MGLGQRQANRPRVTAEFSVRLRGKAPEGTDRIVINAFSNFKAKGASSSALHTKASSPAARTQSSHRRAQDISFVCNLTHVTTTSTAIQCTAMPCSPIHQHALLHADMFS